MIMVNCTPFCVRAQEIRKPLWATSSCQPRSELEMGRRRCGRQAVAHCGARCGLKSKARDAAGTNVLGRFLQHGSLPPTWFSDITSTSVSINAAACTRAMAPMKKVNTRAVSASQSDEHPSQDTQTLQIEGDTLAKIVAMQNEKACSLEERRHVRSC